MRLDAQAAADQTTPAPKQTAIAPFSKNMLKNLALYREKRRAYLKAHPVCMARIKCAGDLATEVHHKRGRVGELLTDERYFLAGCHACHVWINENNEQAFALGLSESRLSTTN